MNSYETAGLNGKQVQNRLNAAQARYAAAVDSITERQYRRGPSPVCPDDAPTPPPPPPRPTRPAEIDSAVNIPAYLREGTGYYRQIWGDGQVKDEATPAQIVAAIRAADALADAAEEAARQYERSTAQALTAHLIEQAEAIKTLAALVAGGR